MNQKFGFFSNFPGFKTKNSRNGKNPTIDKIRDSTINFISTKLQLDFRN